MPSGVFTCIVVPGGGKFAENIRKMQKEFKFSDEVAHKMALLSMKQYAFFLKGLHNNIKIIKDVKKIEENNNSYLWSPDYLLENDYFVIGDNQISFGLLTNVKEHYCQPGFYQTTECK